MRPPRARRAVRTLLLLSLVGAPGAAAAVTPAQFDNAYQAIRAIPYNPRPIATDTTDVTGVTESNTRTAFLAEFTRVTIAAPANGYTFASADPANAPDLTLVGYERIHGPGATRPAIVLSHGGNGEGSLAGHQAFLVHLARVLYANGYDVLAVDTRAGLLTRCGYSGSPAAPDAAKSVAWQVGGLTTDFCDTLSSSFRDITYVPNTRPGSFGAFEAGDLLAAASYFKAKTGAARLGVLAGSRGGLAVIRAAALQAAGVTGFPAGLLDAILAMSPVGHDDTAQFTSSSTTFSCTRATAAQHYSAVHGTGIGDYAVDPAGTTASFYALLDGITAIGVVDIPALTVHTLSDDQVFAWTTFAYQEATDVMPLARSLVMTRVGHFHEIWQSDPFWGDRLALVYFKRMLAPGNATITTDPGFAALGPNTSNPVLVHPGFGAAAPGKLVSGDSIVPYLGNGVCFP